MNTYSSQQLGSARMGRSEFSGSAGRTWGILVLGLTIGMMGAQIFITRPLLKQMEVLQTQVQGVNRDLELLAGLRDQWTVASDLAMELASSRGEIEEGWKALEGIRALRAEVALEADRCKSAISTLDGIKSMRDQVADLRGIVGQQWAGLAMMNRAAKQMTQTTFALNGEIRALEGARQQTLLASQLINDVDRQGLGIEKARQTLDGLVQVKNELLRSGHDIEFSRRRADAMLEIVDRLRSEKANAVPALVNLAQLEKLRDRMGQDGAKISSAIDTMDLIAGFQKAMATEAQKLGELRRSLSDIEAISESTRKIIESLSPVARLHDLSHLNDAELRSAARNLLDRQAGNGSTLEPASAKVVE